MNYTNNYPLNTLYFYLTQGCNLKCRHCWLSPKYEEKAETFLSVKTFEFILEQGIELGLTGVKLTGGEPLLHPEILELIKIVQKKQLRLTVETNGVLCSQEIALAIAQSKACFVSVSLDAADEKTHEWMRGVEGSFKQALRGIKNLKAAGISPQIIMTLNQKNKNKIEAIINLAEDLGAHSLKFNIMQPITRGEKLHTQGEALTIEELVVLGKRIENELAKKSKIKLYYDHPPAFKPLGKIFAEDGDGCSYCGVLGILGVLADGSYALCGIGSVISELVFGQAEEDSLKDIWEQAPILNQLRSGLPHKLKGICGECLMKASCFGSCIAQNYYLAKNLWAPFWYCELASQKGLFPKTRLKPAVII